MMQEHSNQWHVYMDGTTLRIEDPGDLTIGILDFDPACVRKGELPPEELGPYIQRHWCYPLEGGEEGIVLEGTLNSYPNNPDAAELHCLHVGQLILWILPEEFSETLYAVMNGHPALPLPA